MEKNKSIKPKKKNINFWENGLTVDESKVSVLVVSLLICVAFAGYSYVKNGDITENFTTIITTLIWGIAGVNVADRINSVFNSNNKKLNNYYDENSMYGAYNYNSYDYNSYNNPSYNNSTSTNLNEQTTFDYNNLV